MTQTTHPYQLGFKFAGNPLGDAHTQLQSQMSLSFGDQLPHFIQHFELKAEARLKAGEHAFQTSKRAAILGVDADTVASLAIAAKSDNRDKLLLDYARLDLSKPVHLKNFFTTLDELSELITDLPAVPKANINVSEFIAKNEFLSKASNKAGEYLDKITELSAWKFLKSTAEKGKLGEKFEKSKEISKELLEKGLENAEALLDKTFDDIRLAAFEVLVIYKDEKPHVTFFVSGDLVFNERFKRNFNHVQLPEKLMPTLDARLLTMLNQFCLDQDHATALSSTVLGILLDLNGTVSAETQLKPIPLEIFPSETRTIRCDIRPTHAIRVSADYALKRSDNDLELDIRAQFLHDDEVHPAHLSLSMTPESLLACGQALTEPGWQISMLGVGHDIRGRLELLRGFTLHPDAMSIYISDEQLNGSIDTKLNVAPLPINGTIDLGIEAATHQIHIQTFDLCINGAAELLEDSRFNLSETNARFHQCALTFDITSSRKHDGDIHISSGVHLSHRTAITSKLITLPEIGLNAPDATLCVSGVIDGHISIELAQTNTSLSVATFDGSKCHCVCDHLDARWNHLHLFTDSPIDSDLIIRHASHDISGLSSCALEFSWQCQQSPQLSNGNDTVSAIPADLIGRINNIDILMTNNGVPHFENGTGFYDARFFNALIIPETEKAKIAEMIDYAPLGRYLDDLASVVVYPHISGMREFVQRIVKWRNLCKSHNLYSTTKLVHPEDTALVLSLFLFGDDRAVSEILPSTRRILEADGIDRYKLEELIDRAFPNAGLENTGRILKWLNRIFSPIPFPPPQVTHQPALSDDPRYVEIIRALPTANHLYEGDWSDGTIAAQCYRYATGFTPEQIQWMIDNRSSSFTANQIDKLRKLLDIKHRFLNLEPREGTFIVQDYNIHVLLDALFSIEQECIAQDPDILDNSVASCFKTWMSPADTARLITAGISSRYHGIFVQINQARLLDYLVQRGAVYTRAVFYEIGQHNIRTLTALLMSYLAQDQSLLKHPADRVAILSDLLGIELPIIERFAPLHAQSSESYLKALFDAATQIDNSCDAYNAAILRMHSRRDFTEDAPATADTPKSPAYIDHYPDASRLELLQDAIANADAQTTPLVERIDSLSDEEIRKATEIWADVVSQVRDLIATYPETAQTPVFKSFATRLYEGLRICSVLDDLAQNNDEVRGWLSCRTGIPEQELLNASRSQKVDLIVHQLYANTTDMAEILADPLTWFVPRATKSPIDLTIVAAMGVITNGVHGSELETVFERMHRDYGISLVRTDTGLIKPLEFNAERIVAALRTVTTPFVLVGYSQGCANMMFTENLLYTGTPEQRRMLDGLVARNFICSAFNGSVHAICGTEKYRQCMIEGENLFKNLSISVSRHTAGFGLSCLRRTLDSPTINMSMRSFESLAHTGLQILSRDAQYKPGVVSFETQGIAKSHIPEALQFMGNHFTRQFDVPNDTQVGADCAHAYPVYNHNESVDLLCREAIPARPLNIHHWSPLVEEIQPVQTALDYQNYDYRGPKSVFIAPWIESLIQFGFVRACQTPSNVIS